MKNENFTLTVVVPYFNEEKTIYKSVKNLIDINRISEIILVDDCSNDSSRLLGKRLSESFEKVQYLRLDKNLGKGGAILSALSLIKTTHIVIHDADLEYNPLDIIKMFNLVEDLNTLIIGSRYLNLKKTKLENLNILLNYIELSSTMLFNKLFKTQLSDIGSCYKLIPTVFLKNNSFFEKGFYTELEILAKFVKKNGPVLEVPISYKGRKFKDGKKNGIFIMLIFFLKIIKLKIII